MYYEKKIIVLGVCTSKINIVFYVLICFFEEYKFVYF